MRWFRGSLSIGSSLLILALSVIPCEANTGKEADSSADITSVPSETDKQDETKKPLTPDGNGTVIDSADEKQDNKHFYTVETQNGNVFYIIVDEEKGKNNVYMTEAVDEESLLSFVREAEAKNKEKVTSSGSGLDEAAIFGKTKEAPTKAEPEPEEVKTSVRPQKNDYSTILFYVAVAVVAFGVIYYIKIYRPKHAGGKEIEEFEDDDFEDVPKEDFHFDEDESEPAPANTKHASSFEASKGVGSRDADLEKEQSGWLPDDE